MLRRRTPAAMTTAQRLKLRRETRRSLTMRKALRAIMNASLRLNMTFKVRRKAQS